MHIVEVAAFLVAGFQSLPQRLQLVESRFIPFAFGFEFFTAFLLHELDKFAQVDNSVQQVLSMDFHAGCLFLQFPQLRLKARTFCALAVEGGYGQQPGLFVNNQLLLHHNV